MAAVQNTLTSINFMTVIISFPGNAFIIVVNIIDFFRNRRLPLSDRLILGLSVFSLLHGLQKGYILYKELLDLSRNEYDKKATQVFMYLNLNTLWFSALLSIHFCLKIVNYKHWFYICLQRRFPKLFSWIIPAFLLGNFFLNLYSALETNPDCPLNTTFTVVMKKSPRCAWSFLIFLTVCFLCTFLCSASGSTILISLLKHMKRIQENSEGSRSPNIEAHVRAVKTVTTLLGANILIFTLLYISGFTEKKLVHLLGILISLCHTFGSYFLIKGTKKLNETLAEILNQCARLMGQNQ